MVWALPTDSGIYTSIWYKQLYILNSEGELNQTN